MSIGLLPQHCSYEMTHSLCLQMLNLFCHGCLGSHIHLKNLSQSALSLFSNRLGHCLSTLTRESLNVHRFALSTLLIRDGTFSMPANVESLLSWVPGIAHSLKESIPVSASSCSCQFFISRLPPPLLYFFTNLSGISDAHTISLGILAPLRNRRLACRDLQRDVAHSIKQS